MTPCESREEARGASSVADPHAVRRAAGSRSPAAVRGLDPALGRRRRCARRLDLGVPACRPGGSGAPAGVEVAAACRRDHSAAATTPRKIGMQEPDRRGQIDRRAAASAASAQRRVADGLQPVAWASIQSVDAGQSARRNSAPVRPGVLVRRDQRIRRPSRRAAGRTASTIKRPWPSIGPKAPAASRSSARPARRPRSLRARGPCRRERIATRGRSRARRARCGRGCRAHSCRSASPAVSNRTVSVEPRPAGPPSSSRFWRSRIESLPQRR